MSPLRAAPGAAGGARLAALSALLLAGAAAGAGGCESKDTCKVTMDALVDRLVTTGDSMKAKQQTVAALEELRTGVLTGKRIELPSAQRQHLERGNPVIGQVTFDARHRPVSTNVSRHFKPLRMLAEGLEVRHQAFLALKRSSSPKAAAAPSAVLVTIDSASKLSVWSLEGSPLLEDFDLGHGAGRSVTRMALSPSQDNHFVLSADDAGVMRVHSLKITGVKKEKKAKGEDQSQHALAPQLTISTNFSCSFELPAGPRGEPRKLTTVLPLDRGTQTWFVTGDNVGGIAVFFRNGTLKGRARVAEDPGGIVGLLRGQGGSIIYSSAYSFGFFSPTQLDVQYPPCTGWNSPLVDLTVDSGTGNKVILALQDGDAIVFNTASGKSKACDLTMKFPHVSTLPFKLSAFKGHIMALPTPPADISNRADFLREIFFFNMQAMEQGYGVAPSRSVALQASFRPRQPDDFVISTSGGSPQDRTGKAYIAIRFEGEKGVELFELSLKQPSLPKVGGAGGGEGGGADDGWQGWLNWFPKVGVFGISLVGVIFWNLRKVTNAKGGGGGGGGGSNFDEFDEEFFRKRREQLAEKRAEKMASAFPQGAGGGGVGMGGGGDRVEDITGDDD